jgi:RNA polymerase sigma-70 factor (ECF subfamily)
MSDHAPSDASLAYTFVLPHRAGGQQVRLEDYVAEQFAKLRKPMYQYLTATLCGPADAEEITQETFLRMYLALHRGQPIRHTRSWVFRVAHNIAVERWKAQNRLPVLDAPLDELTELLQSRRDPGLDPEQQILEQERRLRLRTAWLALTPHQRQCLRLRVEGLRYREIAEVLGITISTVADLLERSIAKLTRETNG